MIYKSLLRHKLVYNGAEYPPTGYLARVPSRLEFIDGQPFEVLDVQNVQLPPPEEGVEYIVPKIVAMLCKDRTDLVCPSATIKSRADDNTKEYCQYLAKVIIK